MLGAGLGGADRDAAQHQVGPAVGFGGQRRAVPFERLRHGLGQRDLAVAGRTGDGRHNQGRAQGRGGRLWLTPEQRRHAPRRVNRQGPRRHRSPLARSRRWSLRRRHSKSRRERCRRPASPSWQSSHRLPRLPPTATAGTSLRRSASITASVRVGAGTPLHCDASITRPAPSPGRMSSVGVSSSASWAKGWGSWPQAPSTRAAASTRQAGWQRRIPDHLTRPEFASPPEGTRRSFGGSQRGG